MVSEQLIPELLKDDGSALCVDETPWKENAELLWLWAFVSLTSIVYCIGKRQRAVITQILGEHIERLIMSDGLGAYRDLPNRLRCWAHLIRKARGLSESLDEEAQAFGQDLNVLLYLLMHCIYRLRDGPPAQEADAIRRSAVELRGILRTLCELHTDHAHKDARALAREFLNDWEAIVRVIEEPHRPLTNNAAERALRHWVILRRILFGTRNAQGSEVLALLASVIATCRLRQLNPWRYLAEVVEQRRKGLPAPVMPMAA